MAVNGLFFSRRSDKRIYKYRKQTGNGLRNIRFNSNWLFYYNFRKKPARYVCYKENIDNNAIQLNAVYTAQYL